eukprot:Seg226.3 transcript_id=Seg226.3/GoldUCD/mRNA.D3Y31 product="hypothetical protein" protein_id=Seg226.3/GoldUCD/D3Y31
MTYIEFRAENVRILETVYELFAELEVVKKKTKQVTMKATLCILLVVLSVALAMEKRHIFEKCSAHSDCGADRCCVSYKLYKFCADQLDEGSLCNIRSKMSCGCKAGLECKGGYFIKRCVKEEGSGDGF